MTAKKKRTTSTKKAPQITYPPAPCAFCGIEHQRKGKYCSDACKQKDYRKRLELKQLELEERATAEIAEESPVTLRINEPQLETVEPLSIEVQQFIKAMVGEASDDIVIRVTQGILQNLQITAFAGVQMTTAPQPVYQPPMRQLLPDDDTVMIETKHVKSDGAAITQNFLKSVSQVTGAQLTAPKPERTIKLNGKDTPMSSGIKKLDVPTFAPPSFDDDEIEIG